MGQPTPPRTGAERYFAERLEDPDYAEAYRRNGTEGPPLTRRELVIGILAGIVFLLILGFIGGAENALLGRS